MIGTRAAKICGADAKYFSNIDECVPLTYTSMPTFLKAYLVDNICHGMVINSLEGLEGLRYCDTIDAGLTISINDANADFSSLYDINRIRGMFVALKFDE